eukprot:4244883-Amphidinium_carterae.3
MDVGALPGDCVVWSGSTQRDEEKVLEKIVNAYEAMGAPLATFPSVSACGTLPCDQWGVYTWVETEGDAYKGGKHISGFVACALARSNLQRCSHKKGLNGERFTEVKQKNAWSSSPFLNGFAATSRTRVQSVALCTCCSTVFHEKKTGSVSETNLLLKWSSHGSKLTEVVSTIALPSMLHESNPK